jgi:hypothetical protein
MEPVLTLDAVAGKPKKKLLDQVRATMGHNGRCINGRSNNSPPRPLKLGFNCGESVSC